MAGAPSGQINLNDLVTGQQNVAKAINNLSATMKAVAIYGLVAAPATATSAGSPGQVALDASFAYFCISTNVWKRVAIATW